MFVKYVDGRVELPNKSYWSFENKDVAENLFNDFNAYGKRCMIIGTLATLFGVVVGAAIDMYILEDKR